MFNLTEFDLHKLYGFIYSGNEKYEDAINEFLKALEVKEDAQIYYKLADCYRHIREYEAAQKYAAKAVNNGYDAYLLYKSITWGNLRNYGMAKMVIEEGTKKHFSSACLAYTEYVEDYDKPKYIDMAFECASDQDKYLVAFTASNMYRELHNKYPGLIEDKSEYYLKKYNEYSEMNNMLFIKTRFLIEQYERHPDFDVMKVLFQRFDSDIEARLILLFILLEKHYKETGNNNFDRGSVIYKLLISLVRQDNKLARMIELYINTASGERMRELYYMVRPSDYAVPTYFLEPLDKFADTYIDMMMDDLERDICNEDNV